MSASSGAAGALAAAALFFAAVPAGASAAEPAGTSGLAGVVAERPVRDTVLIGPTVRASANARSDRTLAQAAFTDANGVVISLDTTVPGYDLAQPASVLNSTHHGTELATVKIHVVLLADMQKLCGDRDAVACYRGDQSGRGELWYAADDRDWVHSLVHEYGHHVDNQLANLSQLAAYGYGAGCNRGTDGTRNWFFSRINASNTTDSDRFRCRGADWDHLLSELYAEDFVRFNGIIGWQLASARPPTSEQLEALKGDLERPLLRTTTVINKKIRHRKFYWRTIQTPDNSLLNVKTSGARGRDFDVYVFRYGSSDVWKKSATSGRVERLTTFIEPGKWVIGVAAYRNTGNARIEIRLR